MLVRAGSVPNNLELEQLFAEIAHLPAVGLAVSGGGDSLGLMLLVREWLDQRDEAPRVHVYTLDHGLRRESASEAEFVRGSADVLGFPATVLQWKGPKPSSGIQAAARRQRYRLIGKAMSHHEVPVLMTAHHREDQAETVMMRLAHGSGIEGLAGMTRWSRIEGVRVHRPLLDFPRDGLRDAVARTRMTPAEDPSNNDPAYERVRWRQIMPILDDLGLDSSCIGRFARRLERAEKALDAAAARAALDNLQLDGFGIVSIERAALSRLEDEIRLRIIAQMVQLATGRPPPRLHQLETLTEVVTDPEFAGLSVAGCALRLHENRLVVFREAARIADTRLEVAPGRTVIWDERFEIANQGSDPVIVSPALRMTREDTERLTGGRVDAPMAGVRAAPLVVPAEQETRAVVETSCLGTYCRMGGVRVSHARLTNAHTVEPDGL